MPRIRVVLEDDNGDPIGKTPEKVYVLKGPCDDLDQIECSVEQFKRHMLPDVERGLLEQAQQRAVEAKKNSGLGSKRNNSRQD